jgi:hypothetical protein
MSLAYRGWRRSCVELRTVDEALEQLLKVGDADAEPAIRDLRRQIRAFEPSVTMIGQVKAGKTSLVNAMVGRPGLLPADINPWTSVITSLHVSPRIREDRAARQVPLLQRRGMVEPPEPGRPRGRTGPPCRRRQGTGDRAPRSSRRCARNPVSASANGSSCCWGRSMITAMSIPNWWSVTSASATMSTRTGA